MPIYEYHCPKCDKTSEIMQKFSDPPLDSCTECGGPVIRLVSKTSFQLKGTGWYQTDYKKNPEKMPEQKPEKKPENKNEKSGVASQESPVSSNTSDKKTPSGGKE